MLPNRLDGKALFQSGRLQTMMHTRSFDIVLKTSDMHEKT
jgi:hypothetical protein